MIISRRLRVFYSFHRRQIAPIYSDSHRNAFKSYSTVDQGLQPSGAENKPNPLYDNVKARKSSLIGKIFNETDESMDTLISHLASDIKDKNRVYRNDVVHLLARIDVKTHISSRDAAVFIKCCSHFLLDENPEQRMKYLEQVWSLIKKSSELLNTDIYNELLKCYTANGHKIVVRNFLHEMSPYKPTDETNILLLKNVAQHGDINQMLELLANLKSVNTDATDIVGGILIEGYARANDIKSALNTVASMPSLNQQSSEISKSVINSYIIVGDEINVKKQIANVIDKKIKLTEQQTAEIIQCIADYKMQHLISDCLALFPSETLSASSMSSHLQTFCTKLVNQGHINMAYFIYSHLSAMDIGTVNNTSVYGRILLRESVKVANRTEDILTIVNGLVKSGRNPDALYTAYEAAMHHKKWEIGIELLEKMKNDNKPVRCHFFWPLFIAYGKINGENGIFEIIKLMKSNNVSLDHDTLYEYVIPNMSLSFPLDAIKKFQSNGLTLSECLTPIVLTLIKAGNIKSASDLCESVDGKLHSELLLLPILSNYLSHKDFASVHNLLKACQTKAINSNIDWIGKFLITFISYRKWDIDLNNFENLIRALSESDTKISSLSVDRCKEYLNRFKEDPKTVEKIKGMLNGMINLSLGDNPNVSRFSMTSQDTMTTRELETHFIELESSNLNSRGVLRKLLQQYCQQNNFDKAKEILEKCENKKIIFSPGMKASIMHMFVKCNDLKRAELYLEDLIKSDSKFVLDEFKIIDYATLLVSEDQISKAIDILHQRAKAGKIRGGSASETNCWNLLNAVAAKYTPQETYEMLSLLNKLNYCAYSNILLGPLVRAHLLKSDIKGAVGEFVICAEKYGKTPLKHEILCTLASHSSNAGVSIGDKTKKLNLNKEDYQNLLLDVLNCIRKTHGLNNSQISLIAAFAETNLTKSLRNYFHDPSLEIKQEELLYQCERFTNENKVQPLINIADSIEGVKNFNSDEIYEMIMLLYGRNDNFDSAIKLWNVLREKNMKPTPKTVEILYNTLKSNKKDIPEDVMNYLGAKNEGVVN